MKTRTRCCRWASRRVVSSVRGMTLPKAYHEPKVGYLKIPRKWKSTDFLKWKNHSYRHLFKHDFVKGCFKRHFLSLTNLSH